MKILTMLGACAVLLAGAVDADAGPIQPEEFALQEWKISKIHCPVACDKEFKATLQGYLGATVQLGPEQFSGAMFEACDGPTEVVLKTQPKQEKLDELKQLLAASGKFNPASLQLPNPLVSAVVYCQGTNGVVGGSGARILSIEEKRVLVLFGEQAVLELRK